ncbi:NERD domain-containing protein [Robertmurraya andreesenii]|uniref:NERD domain-containing protein n=1 Tax=Anoxybacillus andreesenii TaxID=1325932 RepID=A0ABT9UZT9_9BACL|nr:NERD domain-containing protein [Robertmurraya andreesenii]MDQ0154209.1 hypothetical protein [Robertmurraya andreesenii]
MFINEIAKPVRLKKLEALSLRISDLHPKAPEVTQDLIRQKSGYKGERAVAYYLDFLPEKETFIFHNLRLPTVKHHFQIDFLALTRHAAFILECKNIFGELFFDSSFNQLIRTANNQEEGFPDPVSQVKWHQKQLHHWLEHHNLGHLPIHPLVVMSNPTAILKKSPNDREITKTVVKIQNLIERMEEIESRNTQEILELKDMRKLSKTLLRVHTPEDIDILKYYGINKSEITTGVQCPECKQFAMVRCKRKWFCEKCLSYSRDAHEKAIEDYFLLIDSFITNQKFREFTHLPSIFTANRLLNSMNLAPSGTNKGRSYSLKKE